MKLRPAGHRILVKLKDVEQKSKGGIILASDTDVRAQRYATQEAEVIELGQTAYKAFDDGTPWVKVGDTVLIAKYSGENREDPETKEIFRIINDEDVIGTIEE